MSEGDGLLIGEDIKKCYRDGEKVLPVLKGVDLKLNKGEIVSIVGKSGTGKSTLLHILGGLDKPTSGRVYIMGRQMYSLDDGERAKVRCEMVGFVFQFYHLLPEFTLLENTMLPSFISKSGGGPNTKGMREVREKAMQILKTVGLEEREDHKPSALSGGEQQRGAIARALMNDPKILFADEPTGNLDKESGRMVLELLLQMNLEKRLAICIVTHDPQVAGLAHRCLEIEEGKLKDL